jgi:ribosome recycling factor
MSEEILMESEESMDKAIDHLVREFASMRTGRANVHLLDNIKVSYYGADTPLNQLATVSAPEPTLITIAPFDPGVLGEIEKSIHKSGLGVNPANDGKIIRLPIPPLTEERRKEMAKMCAKLGEEAKTSVRNVRRDANDALKKAEKNKELSEDLMHDAMADVQKLTDNFTNKIDDFVKKKQEEIMQV